MMSLEGGLISTLYIGFETSSSSSFILLNSNSLLFYAFESCSLPMVVIVNFRFDVLGC